MILTSITQSNRNTRLFFLKSFHCLPVKKTKITPLLGKSKRHPKLLRKLIESLFTLQHFNSTLILMVSQESLFFL